MAFRDWMNFWWREDRVLWTAKYQAAWFFPLGRRAFVGSRLDDAKFVHGHNSQP